MSRLLRLSDGRVVGEIVGHTLTKKARGSRHMLRKPAAWCFDCEALARAEELGATRVEIRDIETGRVYSAPISLFHERGIVVNRGYGRQLAALVSDFKVCAV